jgi:hypothetical protein
MLTALGFVTQGQRTRRGRWSGPTNKPRFIITNRRISTCCTTRAATPRWHRPPRLARSARGRLGSRSSARSQADLAIKDSSAPELPANDAVSADRPDFPIVDLAPRDEATDRPLACTPGMNQSCNDNLLVSSIWGTCQPDGTCLCTTGHVINPDTGRCMIAPVSDASTSLETSAALCTGDYTACGCAQVAALGFTTFAAPRPLQSPRRARPIPPRDTRAGSIMSKSRSQDRTAPPCRSPAPTIIPPCEFPCPILGYFGRCVW